MSAIASTFPTVEEIEVLAKVTDPEILALEKEIREDMQLSGDPVGNCEKLPDISAKYACLLGKLELLECQADERAKLIRSRIVLAFEDNPKAFLNNTKHRNMQICEAVYRSHPQYREAISRQLHVGAMRKMVAQAAYAIDHKRTMLESLMRAKLAGVYEVNMKQAPSGSPIPMRESL